MTAPTTRLSYGDAFDAFDRAKDDPKGIRVRFKTWDEANTFRSRLHYARAIDRRDNTQIYTEDDALYGRSSYDTLMARIKEDSDGKWWVYIEHVSLGNRVVESLSQLDEPTDVEFEEVPQIEVEKPKQIEEPKRLTMIRRI